MSSLKWKNMLLRHFFCGLLMPLIVGSATAQTFTRAQLVQQWRMTCSAQNLRASPFLGPQCQQWKAQIDAMKDEAPLDAEDDDDAPAPAPRPVYVPPTGTDPSGPVCQTGQRELIQAQSACGNGDTAMCTRADQLRNALRTMSCAIPVLGGGRPNSSESSDSRQPQSAKAQKPLVNHCVRQQRTQSGAIELYNGCGFPINYAFCVRNPSKEGASSAFACEASVNSRGMDSILPGRTSWGYRGDAVVFAACEGGLGSGNTSHLEGGRGSCR